MNNYRLVKNNLDRIAKRQVPVLAGQGNWKRAGGMVRLHPRVTDSWRTAQLHLPDEGAADSMCSQSEPCGTLN